MTLTTIGSKKNSWLLDDDTSDILVKFFLKKLELGSVAPIPTSISLNLSLSSLWIRYLVVTPRPIGAWLAFPLDGAYWIKSPVTKPWSLKLIELSTVWIPTGLTINFLLV